MIKEFLLFSGSAYYPSGGMYDYVASYDSIEEAKQAVTDDWAHIVRYSDLVTVATFLKPMDIPNLPEGAPEANIKNVKKMYEINKTRGWIDVRS